MRSYKLYIFDFDDTLIMTYNNVLKLHYPLLAKQLGLKYKGESMVKKHWGKSLNESLPKIFPNISNIKRTLEVLKEIHELNPISPADSIQHILKTLKNHDKYIAIATSNNSELVEQSIKKSLGIEPDFFDYIHTINKHNIKKPSHQIILNIHNKIEYEKKQKILKEDIVYIGDSLNDFFSAKEYNIDFYAVTTGINSKEEFLNAGLGEDFIFENVKNILIPPLRHGIVALIQNSSDEFLLVKEGRTNSPFFGHWSGPHGRCEFNDVIEEETVQREVLEECGLNVKSIVKLYERSADTKIDTVAFWLAKPIKHSQEPSITSEEVSDITWASVEVIKEGKFPLYPGTKDYFLNHYSSKI